MRHGAARVLLVLVVTFAVISPALAGIDETYVKPADKKSWGDLLLDFVGHPGFDKSYALVVGISRFDDFSSLPTANDPLRVRDFLLNEAGFDYVHVLTDEKATKPRIEELMVDVLPGMIHENDQFLFYWSGHGTQRPNALGGQLGYLPLASSPKARYATMISMGDIQRWDEVLAAKQALFLLDACFSGLAGVASKSDTRELQIDQLDKPAHHLVSAGTAEEETIAGDRWGGSIFTDAVLRAIKGEADAETSYPKDGVVSLSELIGYVKTRVANEASAVGWTKPITPQPYKLRPSPGEFFFLTNDRKVAKLKSVGARHQGRFEYGLPVVVMGNEAATMAVECDLEADWRYYETIRNETEQGYFEAYLKMVESGELCGQYADIARLKRKQVASAQPDPAAAEASLNLRPEDRTVVQQALRTLEFDSGVLDGIFGALSRRAIAGWQRTRGDEPTGYLTASQYGRVLAEAEQKLAEAAPEPVVLEPESLINFGQYYALVIGNTDYQYSRDLSSPEADAMAISALLKQKYGYTAFRLMNANRNQILDSLNTLRENLRERDNLLIYYAGHGVRDEENSRCYWLPVDSEPYPQTANWISTDDITDLLNSMQAKHVIVVADSCYSSSLTSNYDSPFGLGVPQEERFYWLKTIADKPARMALTSGNLSPVLDGGGGQHSIFARALLEVLGTNDRVMEGWRLYLRASARVSDVAQVYGVTQVLTYGPIKSEKYAGGDFLFVRS